VLVLTRHVHQSIVIGHDVVVTVLEVRGDQVRLGITAPREIQVHREEVFAALTAANRQAAASATELEVLRGLGPEAPSPAPAASTTASPAPTASTTASPAPTANAAASPAPTANTTPASPAPAAKAAASPSRAANITPSSPAPTSSAPSGSAATPSAPSSPVPAVTAGPGGAVPTKGQGAAGNSQEAPEPGARA
jgi:carbon storage regulator